MDISSPRIEEHMHFICPECGLELPTQILWRKHLNTLHDYNKKTVDVFNFKEINERYHECNECHKWVANGNQSITTLQYHRISHLPFNLTFKCRHCVKSFSRKRVLCEHLKEVHKININTNVSMQMETQFPSLECNLPKSTEEDFEDMSDMKSKRDSSDLIQKALLDSLIDLENETFAEQNKTGNLNDVNDFAVNQSLTDLEEILKGDLDAHMLTQQYSNTQNQNGLQCAEGSNDIEDNELLDQICADIFEEVIETPEIALTEQKVEQPNYRSGILINSATKNSSTERSCVKIEPYGEEIISIEIDTVNESDRRDMYSAQKRKRLKLDLAPSKNLETNSRIKRLLETYILYLCPECGRQFKTQSEWRIHVFRAHDVTNTIYAKFQALKNGTAHYCLDCREILQHAKTQDLMRHRFTHMPFQSYLKCTFCAKTKSSKQKIMQHLQDFHASTLPMHRKEMKPPSHFSCSLCNKSFQTPIRLQDHQGFCLKRRRQTSATMSSDSIIRNNLNLITHLKKMRARMRTLHKADNAESNRWKNSNSSVKSCYRF